MAYQGAQKVQKVMVQPIVSFPLWSFVGHKYYIVWRRPDRYYQCTEVSLKRAGTPGQRRDSTARRPGVVLSGPSRPIMS